MSVTTKHRKSSKKSQERRAAFLEMAQQLEGELKEGKHTERLEKAVKTVQGIERYSPLNQLLILTQRPDATDVAGYVAWQERGYRVPKGGIAIRAPHTIQAEGEEGGGVGFHRVYVWDISQVTPIEEAATEPNEKDTETTAPTARLDVSCEKAVTPTNSLATLLEKREPVAPHVLKVLQAAYFEGDKLVLPMQLEREDYVDTNKVLERIGGKWNRKQKGHLFEDEENPQELLRLVLETGEMPPKNPTSYYPSPQWLAERLAETIPPGTSSILEPSAGTGSIARAIREYCHGQKIDAQLECCEILPKFQSRLNEQGFTVVADDFFTYQPQAHYDVILMNPPYAVEGDPVVYVAHVLHAWDLLAEGGLLQSVVPSGFTFRQDKRIVALRELVEEVGSWQELPRATFKESAGTSVNTVLLEMYK